MKKRIFFDLSLLLIFTLALTACGQKKEPASSNSSPKASDHAKNEADINRNIEASDKSKLPALAKERKDTFVLGIDIPEGVFNPLYAESAYDTEISAAIFDSLVTSTKDGSYQPKMADYTISEDGLTYKFTLKEGIKWADGQELTTKDIAFTIKLLYDKSYDGPADPMNNAVILGVRDFKEGKTDQISGMKIIDSKTIEFKLEKVNALALSQLGGTVLPEHYYGQGYKHGDLAYLKDTLTKPEGNGPYILKKFDAGQQAVLEANPSYFLGEPKVKNLIFKFTDEATKVVNLQNGETDGDNITSSKEQVDTLQDLAFLNLFLRPNNGYGYIAMNNKDPKFKDIKVRQALMYGLDRKTIVDSVYQGYARVTNVQQSDVSWSYTDKGINPYKFNTKKAKKLLDEAGWKLNDKGIREKDGVEFKIHFAASTPNPVNEVIIPIATKNYKELGIEFIAEQMDFNALRAKMSKFNYDMAFLAWGLTNDPQSQQSTYRTEGSQNNTGYGNPELDKLYEEANATTNQEARKETFKKIYQTLNHDVPEIMLYQRADLRVVNARVKGFEEITPFYEMANYFHTFTLEK